MRGDDSRQNCIRDTGKMEFETTACYFLRADISPAIHVDAGEIQGDISSETDTQSRDSYAVFQKAYSLYAFSEQTARHTANGKLMLENADEVLLES